MASGFMKQTSIENPIIRKSIIENRHCNQGFPYCSQFIPAHIFALLSYSPHISGSDFATSPTNFVNFVLYCFLIYYDIMYTAGTTSNSTNR